jgi:tRNA U34 2-thiouridine synthase MnmA/TrmU
VRDGGFRAEVRIRHRAAPVPATVRPASGHEPARGGRWIVETDEPVWAAAPGQACVFDAGEVVLGGGRIERPAPAGRLDQREPTGRLEQPEPRGRPAATA